ncbi:ALP1-like protein isoform X1 [Tanacetum coccineum]
MNPNNDMSDFYDYYTKLDMDRYRQYYEYFEQYESLEGDEGESSVGNSERLSRRYIPREREVAEEKLRRDYFGDENTPPIYPEEYFRRRYRMSSRLFKKIVHDITNYDVDPLPDYFYFFKQRPDCTGRLGLSAILKCTSAIRQLAYGTSPDAFDEYLQVAERCSRECLWNFTKCIYILYVEEFLRKPNLEDVQHVYELHERKHGLPGMLGSIDCMHWEWTKCPKALHGQFKRRDKKYPTIMLEAVADQQLWFWHAYFGVPGANNDLNVLYGSPLFDDLLTDKAPEALFAVNGKTYEKGYYLADGIYPQWSTFVKAFTIARDKKPMKFKRVQESARKDIERAFGVLQGRWGIITQPVRAYQINTIKRIMYCCIILHNMILDDQDFDISEYTDMYVSPESNIQRTWVERCERLRRKNKELRDRRVHDNLRHDIVEHLWNLNH